MNASRFNPLKALVAGQVDLELKVLSSNVTMRFNNFDMFSTKQPPMFAVMDDAKANSSTQNWKLGNFVTKDVYDNVTLIIPYNEGDISESGTFNISILYTEDPSESHQLIAWWNRSRGDDYNNLTDEFIAYNASRYRDYLTTTGINCSKNNSNYVCFINTSSNELIIEIPHFSGVESMMAITTLAKSSSSTGSGGESGGGIGSYWDKTESIDNAELDEGVEKIIQVKHRLKINLSGETHYLGVVEINDSFVTINISSDPIQEIFSVGEKNKFELNGDDYYDLFVKLNEIEGNNKARLTIKKIHEKIPSLSPSDDEFTKSDTRENPQMIDENKSYLWLFVGIIIVLIVIGFWLMRRRNE